MRARHNLTQLVVVAALQTLSVFAFSGCGASHERGDDAGGAADAGRPADGGAPQDGGGAVDAGRRGRACEAEDARAELCPELLCDGPPSWHWDGERCLPIECGACVGEDCAASVVSEAECVAAHARCEPSLCRATMGTWLWWAEECGHYECGFAPPAICEVGMPVCDCGDGRGFRAGVGCVPVPDCPEVDPLPPDVLCAETRGSWEPICCHAECGVRCPLACAEMACDCGPERVFDVLRGCVVGARCLERLPDEPCGGRARCEEGTICCDDCGGAGCAGTPTCRYPLCVDDPAIDACGNDTRAP